MSNPMNPLVKRLKDLGDYKPGASTTSQSQPDLDTLLTEKFGKPVAEKLGREVNTLMNSINKPKKQSSFVAVLCDLDVGGSAVRNHSPNADITLAQLAEELSEMKAMISNNVRPSVRIATEKTGFTYSVETSQTITSAGRVYVQVIVTRTA